MAEQMQSEISSGNSAQPSPRRMPSNQVATLFRSAAFGDVVSVLMRAPKHKKLSLEALRTFLLPAMANNQFLIAKLRPQEQAGAVAAGVALWASVSDEVDQRLRACHDQPLRLAAEEWKSGPHLWLIDLIAPSALLDSMLNDLEQKVAKGKPMAAQIALPEGKARIATLEELRAEITKKAS